MKYGNENKMNGRVENQVHGMMTRHCGFDAKKA